MERGKVREREGEVELEMEGKEGLREGVMQGVEPLQDERERGTSCLDFLMTFSCTPKASFFSRLNSLSLAFLLSLLSNAS